MAANFVGCNGASISSFVQFCQVNDNYGRLNFCCGKGIQCLDPLAQYCCLSMSHETMEMSLIERERERMIKYKWKKKKDKLAFSVEMHIEKRCKTNS